MALVVKKLPANVGDIETCVWSLDWEDTLEEGMPTHSSFLVGKIPWTEVPGGLQSIGPESAGHSWATKHTHIIYRESNTLTWSAASFQRCRGGGFVSTQGCGEKPIQREGEVFQRSKIICSVFWWKTHDSGIRKVRLCILSLSSALCSLARNCSGHPLPLQNEALSNGFSGVIVRIEVNVASLLILAGVFSCLWHARHHAKHFS